METTESYCLEVDLGTVSAQVSLFWNAAGLVKSIKLVPYTSHPTRKSPVAAQNAHDVPYAVAVLAREIKNYFTRGEPFVSFHWSLFDPTVVTPFQKEVAEAAFKIPFGETRTYAWVAQKMGKPKAARAVGQALKRNPFILLIPCHRVVSEHDLGGFMGSRDPTSDQCRMKKRLLEIESYFIHPPFSFLNPSENRNLASF